jgi:hypothetical protein
MSEDDIKAAWVEASRLIPAWAERHGVRFVSRSHGQATTDTVSRDALVELAMRAARAPESAVLARAPEQAGVVRDAEDAARYRLWRKLYAEDAEMRPEMLIALADAWTETAVDEAIDAERRAIDSKGAPE